MQPITRPTDTLERRLWHHLDYYQSTEKYLRRLEARFSEADSAAEIEALNEEINSTKQELEQIGRTCQYLEGKISAILETK